MENNINIRITSFIAKSTHFFKTNILVLVTLLCPAFGLVAGFYETLKNNRSKESAFCFALFLSSIAYSYALPNDLCDLYEYFQNMKSLRNLTLFQAFDVNGLNIKEFLPLSLLLQWIVAKTGDFHLLPAFTVFIIYFIGIYITSKISEDLKIDKLNKIICVSFILLYPNFTGIISNIRNIFSFSIFGYAVYRELYENKKNCLTYLIYTIPLFIHSATFVLLGLRIFCNYIGNNKSIFLLLSLLSKSIVDFAYTFINFIPEYLFPIKIIFYKAYRYFNSVSDWAILASTSGSHRLAKFIYIFITLLLCLSIGLISKNATKIKLQNYYKSSNYVQRIYRFMNFEFSCGLVTVACWAMPLPEYWRFVSLFILLISIIYLVFIKFYNNVFRLFICSIIQCLVFPCFILWFRNLLKTNVVRLIIEPFFCSPITIFFNIIFNLL